MTLDEMREKIHARLMQGKFFDQTKSEWSEIGTDEKGTDEKGTDEQRTPEGRVGLRLRLYTDRHSYAIVMYADTGDRTKTYLGCVMDNRTPWTGENHTRGNDLADGAFSDATLDRIFADILSCELLRVTTLMHQCGAPDGCGHKSDCALHNAPALPLGPCSCGAAEAKSVVEL